MCNDILDRFMLGHERMYWYHRWSPFPTIFFVSISFILLNAVVGKRLEAVSSVNGVDDEGNRVRTSSYYWERRQLVCSEFGLPVSRCVLKLNGRNKEYNPECFEAGADDAKVNEKVAANNRTYCKLLCEEADETTVLAKVPNNNHHCNTFFTYQLERRRDDWYIWRSGRCLNTTITIDVRCGFPRDPQQFYVSNADLFEYEDAKN